MTDSPLAATVMRYWRAGRDTHAIAEALGVRESLVVKIIHADRNARLTGAELVRIAQTRRRWP